jgi:hypothetical protein
MIIILVNCVFFDSNLCYCGNYLNQPSVNSILCNLPCHRSLNDITIDCCGGLNTFSIYNVDNYR